MKCHLRWRRAQAPQLAPLNWTRLPTGRVRLHENGPRFCLSERLMIKEAAEQRSSPIDLETNQREKIEAKN